ncbi:DUF1153 domain-containing protein [Phenylobacterium aquaticum]|uniref:CtrA inhibitor SciP n=1 Tax=Phenylobacterium aquaticum TaxID=1763816 RepID=UPI0026F326B9|nr:DUF1153 domain-containing protein [Phenylobacterium aquaticum]
MSAFDRVFPSRRPGVIGPLGHCLTAQDLPRPDLDRWGPRRKAEVVVAIRGGLISLDEAVDRYRLSMEEVANWLSLFDRHGLKGLRVTHLKSYRVAPS